MSVGPCQLRQHGVIDKRHSAAGRLRIRRASESAAKQLAAFLTDSRTMRSRCHAAVQDLRRSWGVSGRTQGTAISSEIIDDWIRWMVLAVPKTEAVGSTVGVRSRHSDRLDGWVRDRHMRVESRASTLNLTVDAFRRSAEFSILAGVRRSS